MKRFLFVLLITCLLVGGIKGVNASTLKIEETNFYFYRIGKPKDVSKCVKWLIEDNYVTGQVISINGGWYI